MAIEQPAFDATRQDTVVVVHTTLADYDLAVITTRLTVDGAPAVPELSEKVRVAPTGDVYRLILNVPEARLVKGQVWVVTVLLPAGASYAGSEPEIERPALHPEARATLTWHGTADPPLDIVWQYLRGRG